jgi:hypothetical protein
LATTEAVVILPDWQVPLDDEPKIKRVAEFVWDFQPARLAHVGDMTDSTQIGRWAKGLREEFDGGLEGGFEKTRSHIRYYRKNYDGPWHLMRSNHDERLELAIEQRLPGLADLTIYGRKLNIQNALRLEEYGIEWHEEPFEIAPDWILAHGDEGSSSKIPGNTALMLAQEMGKNVVCGHSHRAGIAWSSRGHGDKRVPFAGMEVGHAMRLSGAKYLGRARLNNWGNAFGILWLHRTADKKKTEVYPELVPITPDGHFMVNGVRY